MILIAMTVGLAEWIIDYLCPVVNESEEKSPLT